MAFSTLEERYNQVSRQIYNRFSPDKDQLVVIKPDSGKGPLRSGSRIKDDSRLLPFTSITRDNTLITKFLGSDKGKLFLAKQILLQTGNTFKETRIYNPTGVLLGASPFPRQPNSVRHIGDGLASVFGGTAVTREGRGALQIATIKTFLSGPTPRNQTILFGTTDSWIRPEDFIFGDGGKSQNFNSRLYNTTALKFRGLPKTFTSTSTSMSLAGRFDVYSSQSVAGIEPVTYFKKFENTGLGNGYFYGSVVDTTGPFTQTPNTSKRSQLIDPFNFPTSSIQPPDDASLYYEIEGDRSTKPDSTENGDIIKFIFTTNKKDAQPVHFRAFISTFKQNVKPEYSEQRYIGRTERYVTYGGVKRTATMEFDIVAFSEREIENVWKRVNYLTGLAFPLGVNPGGFIIPPLFRLTVGGIYINQPCYIETLDFDFLNEGITFDINQEVSQLIHVNMSIVLLEKNTKKYDSPFYAIVGDEE